MVNAWGDSYRANESYDVVKPSVLDNDYQKVIKESTDDDILNTIDYLPATTAVTETTKLFPTIEIVSRYTNSDVKANPNKIYVFGDNTQRIGTGGQAQIRNNSNAMGIATKIAPSMDESAFMTDKDLSKNRMIIDEDIAKIKATGKLVVFPKDGLGTGLAKLKEKAPQTYAYLKQRLLQEFGFDNDMGTLSQPSINVNAPEGLPPINRSSETC
jgi:hypothetical protein